MCLGFDHATDGWLISVYTHTTHTTSYRIECVIYSFRRCLYVDLSLIEAHAYHLYTDHTIVDTVEYRAQCGFRIRVIGKHCATQPMLMMTVQVYKWTLYTCVVGIAAQNKSVWATTDNSDKLPFARCQNVDSNQWKITACQRTTCVNNDWMRECTISPKFFLGQCQHRISWHLIYLFLSFLFLPCQFLEFWGSRHFVTFMLFLGMANAYVMRTNMSVAIVAMVNHTHIDAHNEEVFDDECPDYNQTTEVSVHQWASCRVYR